MKNNNMFGRPILYILIIIYIIVGFSTLTAGEELAGILFREDRYFEDIGVLSFFAASVLFFLAYNLARLKRLAWIKRSILLGLAILFFFGGGEEISWGQRIFNFKEPASLEAINVQGETNIHNIELNGISIPFEKLFDIFWLGFTVFVPFGCLLSISVSKLTEKYIPIIHWGIGLLFVVNYLWAKIAKLLYISVYTYSVIPFVQAVQEVKESNYALLFMFAALYIYLQMKYFMDDTNLDLAK